MRQCIVPADTMPEQVLDGYPYRFGSGVVKIKINLLNFHLHVTTCIQCTCTYMSRYIMYACITLCM